MAADNPHTASHSNLLLYRQHSSKHQLVKSIYFLKPSGGNKERKEKSTKACAKKKSCNITTKQGVFTQI